MVQHTHKETFLQSFNRCATNDEFIRSFYQRFLNSSEDIRRKFRFTDFQKQEKMLLGSLRLCAGATVGDADALAELLERAETHDRYHLGIKPEMYDYWLSAILETVAEFDDQWDAEVDEAWNSILDHVIQHMIRHY